jgi:hypothetical protein
MVIDGRQHDRLVVFSSLKLVGKNQALESQAENDGWSRYPVHNAESLNKIRKRGYSGFTLLPSISCPSTLF